MSGKPQRDYDSYRQSSRFDQNQHQQSQSEASEGYINKNSPTYSEQVTFMDGYQATAVNSSLDHLLTNHGHTFGIDDPIELNPNQKESKYKQIRTRLTPGNPNLFRENIKEKGKNPDLQVFTDLCIRGELGRGYYDPGTNRIVAVATEGAKAGQIIKAQPLSEIQINILVSQNRLD